MYWLENAIRGTDSLYFFYMLCVVFLSVDSPVLFCSVDDGAHLQLSIYLRPPVLLQFHLLLRSHEHTECQSTAYYGL